jgi:hypothetical protein
MSGYQRYAAWARSSQGLWVIAMGLFLLALLDLATGTWWLAAILAVAGAVNVRRAWNATRS